MRLLTVATTNYLYQANVLFSYAKRVHPELRPTVLVADVSKSALRPVRHAFGSEVDVLCCDDLGLDFLKAMRSYYTVLEFCSALKVLGLVHILQQEDHCLFLDPDMMVLDSLREPVLDQPGEMVVCCHTFAPYPKDGAAPNDLELCWTGQINGGVLLTRNGPQGTPALDWLVDKTRNRWFIAPERGMYADQQWFSALPYFFRERTTLVSDRGVNVAYWNLHERPLRRDTTGTIVTLAEGGALRLMHFSGFTIPSKGQLSKHSIRRFDPETEEILVDMVAEYEEALLVSRTRFDHLRGDLGFSNLPLDRRMQIAADYWKDPGVGPLRMSLLPRLWQVLRSKLSHIG